ncbi:MAG: T9SS type A sorting domain-containing protein [Bacteroidetes bacterium]|nr:T9SS type A sorting domain-containing protein [Bacteroidota bacterium]
MKKTPLVLFITLIFILVSAFIFLNPQQSPPIPQENSLAPVNGWDKFYVGAMDNPYNDPNHPNIQTNMDSLGFSLWHRYLEPQDRNAQQQNWYYPKMNWGTGFTDQDNLMADSSTYAPGVRDRIADIYSHNKRRLIISRPKISWLCYGQRSDYQCEDIPANDQLWFYSFQSPNHAGTDITDNSTFGQGRRVRYCEAIPSSPLERIVVSRLKTNTEQCAKGDKDNPWTMDSYSPWKIKPNVRIDSNVAHDLVHNVKVCRVLVLAQDGSTVLKDIDIHANDFLDNNGFYNGKYKEEFNFSGGTNLTIPTDWTATTGGWGWEARGNRAEDTDNNRADIKVYWYGNCDMWIDYVRVENEIADRLLKGNDAQFERWIKDEVTQIAGQTIYGVHPIMKFYLELIEFNNIPCIGYVNKKLKYYSEQKGFQVDLMQDMTPTIGMHVPWYERTKVWNIDFLKRFYMDSTGYTQVFSESYPLTACFNTNSNEQVFSYIPPTLPTTSGSKVLAQTKPTPEAYDDWLQDKIERKPSIYEGGEDPLHCDTNYNCGTGNDRVRQIPFWGSDAGMFRNIMDLSSELSRRTGKPWIFMPQLHQWFLHGEIRREPTNEELNMMSNLAVSYGAKGFQYFWYQSWLPGVPPASFPSAANCEYGTGIEGASGVLIDHNYYGQPGKAATVKAIVDRVANKWGLTLMGFDIQNIKSYMYSKEYTNEYPGEGKLGFVRDLKTYKPILNNPSSHEANPEPLASRYLQLSFLNFPMTQEQADADRYFMIVNKRCAPADANNVGGKRFITIRFDTGGNNVFCMYDFHTFNLIDIKDNHVVTTFVRSGNTGDYVDIDLEPFEPGEGRIYKISPVMRTGGNLLADENPSNPNLLFECRGIVNTNGHSIIYPGGTEIRFGENCGINVTSDGSNIGKFVVNDDSGHPTSFKAIDNAHQWNGITVSRGEVLMQNTQMEGVANNKYLISASDCDFVHIENCEFKGNSGITSGGISINNTHSFKGTPTYYIYNNRFYMQNSSSQALNVTATAGARFPVTINYNQLNSPGSNFGIVLTGVSAAIKGNYFNKFNESIVSMNSVSDMYGNIISSDLNGANGIKLLTSSSANLGVYSGMGLGGHNTIYTIGTDSRNIFLNNSTFSINEGQNTFDINTAADYHLYGFFPSGSGDDALIPARNNCFRKGNVADHEYQYVTSGSGGTQLGFQFTPYSCIPDAPGHDDGGIITDIGDELQDTVYNERPPSGGWLPEYSGAMKTYMNMCVNFRTRDYDSTITMCKNLLDNYTDSIPSADVIIKLFQSNLQTDSEHIKMDLLKSYYEQLIINNPENTELIEMGNYYIQKCLVAINKYEDALMGFDLIIQQNPNTYLGLLASWDYAATILLMNSSGMGGGYSDAMNQEDSDSLGTYNKNIFSKEQRKVFKQNVVTALNNAKVKEEQKTMTLKQKADNGDKEAKMILKEQTILKELVKKSRPVNVEEHILKMDKDLTKLFGRTEVTGTVTNTVLPLDYKLGQNYPNPFNPSTKINYEIKNAGFVSLKVYDLLGREIAELVNETKDAGRYTIDFNASKYMMASGIYFYRIKAGEFVDTKRMVLIK